ncbi:hypothetical protein E6C27_scaffold2405G00100 [Cucumis melo var. makuwa]|uniref:Uncharacterized protein n=1 Tax=Cucumis melo var. makuwa TaxID=1194695 RepID=A0A5A7SKG8_CUCMM|nr:hypothetical protein E6C27_scaffold2405G00100 [Cucumis melo var. makuwa]
MQNQPLQNLGATVNLCTGFSSKPGEFLVFSDALSILEVHKSNQKLYLVWPRGNRSSLQTGELDKTVIFPLSTLSVLHDNDAVVENELPVPDTLPTSAESFESNSRSAGIVRGDDVCWLHAVFRAKQQMVWEGV